MSNKKGIKKVYFIPRFLYKWYPIILIIVYGIRRNTKRIVKNNEPADAFANPVELNPYKYG